MPLALQDLADPNEIDPLEERAFDKPALVRALRDYSVTRDELATTLQSPLLTKQDVQEVLSEYLEKNKSSHGKKIYDPGERMAQHRFAMGFNSHFDSLMVWKEFDELENRHRPLNWCLVVLLWVTPVVLVPVSGTAHGVEFSFCKKSETTIFSCPLLQQKTVAICAGVEGKRDFLEYRYGQHPNVEMRVRVNAANGANKFHRAEVLYASNSEELIWFQKSGVFYHIHMPTRGGPFLEMWSTGRRIGRHDCQVGWGRVKNSPVAGNKFIVDHGSGYDEELSPLWGDN